MKVPLKGVIADLDARITALEHEIAAVLKQQAWTESALLPGTHRVDTAGERDTGTIRRTSTVANNATTCMIGVSSELAQGCSPRQEVCHVVAPPSRLPRA